MKLGDVTWKCQRCGAKAERDVNAPGRPKDWIEMTIKSSHGMSERDLCDKCDRALHLFFLNVPAEVLA